MTKAEKVTRLKAALASLRENREACAEAFANDQAIREMSQKVAAKVFEEAVADILE